LKSSPEFQNNSEEEKKDKLKTLEDKIENVRNRYFSIGIEEQIRAGGEYNEELSMGSQFTHEIGHAIYFQLLSEQDQADVEDSQSFRGGPDISFSVYAETNVIEYFAEMYTLYKSKILIEKKKKIPEKMVSIFKKYAPEKDK
jgi:hypothetical protein